MEQATADRGPEALRAAARPSEHSVTTSDGTEIRLTHYALGTKGPIVLAPGYGNAARAFAVDTVPKNYVQYLGEHGYDVWLLDYRASPDLEAELHPVHGRRHRDARLAGGDRRGQAADRRGLGPGAWATASAACRCSWPSAAASKACARRPSRRWPATRSPRPATAARGRPPRDDVQEGRDQGPEHRLRPRLPARPRGRARDARAALPPRLRQPGRPAHLLRLRRRLRLLEHQRGDDGRRPCRASSASATSRSSSTSRG